ncbi:MAG TPA: 5-formyltetrahydrofolate cyclo-ligase [Hyphomicrobiaceae bacterium]|nr:5-formyltetrahydrofolate cyclo-ligase [Hyphomicrobiaceae bacterium]
MSDDEILAAKKALRVKAEEARRAVLAREGTEIARRIAAHGLDCLGSDARPGPETIVSGFMSMPGEIDTAPLMRWLRAEGYRLAMPAMVGKGAPLTFRSWSPDDVMGKGRWGIAEPLPDKPVVFPAILIVPLLAFDRRGGRLGYGGGYYDRTLASLRRRGRITAIGLGLDELEVDAVPRLDYDEPIDWVLTESGPRRLDQG